MKGVRDAIAFSERSEARANKCLRSAVLPLALFPSLETVLLPWERLPTSDYALFRWFYRSDIHRVDDVSLPELTGEPKSNDNTPFF
jgi:hypothetical protein